MLVFCVPLNSAKPLSSVDSVANLRTGGHWFYPRLGQYFFRGLMIVIATGFIPLSLLTVVSTMAMWESSQWLGKNIVQVKKLQESMGRCTRRHNTTKIFLKTAFNTNQSILLILQCFLNPLPHNPAS